MFKLLIYNNADYHYEILETIIVNYHNILNINKDINIELSLYTLSNNSFNNYIKDKYPSIKFNKITDYDYYINCSIYDKDFDKLDSNINSKKKYISHEITERLKTNLNVYFLTPLSKNNYIYTDILPFSNNKIENSVPIYIIQGMLTEKRRDYNMLIKILDNTYDYKFIIKLLGKGNIPKCLNKYKDKIVLKNNLNFIDYHKEFLDAYCILPLINKKLFPHYYKNKLTSTINYCRGYKLKCLIDKDLQDIYNLNNSIVFNDINDITDGFIKSLNLFYNK